MNKSRTSHCCVQDFFKKKKQNWIIDGESNFLTWPLKRLLQYAVTYRGILLLVHPQLLLCLQMLSPPVSVSYYSLMRGRNWGREQLLFFLFLCNQRCAMLTMTFTLDDNVMCVSSLPLTVQTRRFCLCNGVQVGGTSVKIQWNQNSVDTH